MPGALLRVAWPAAEVPLVDNLRALEEYRAASKIRAIGVCNFGVQVRSYAQHATAHSVHKARQPISPVCTCVLIRCPVCSQDLKRALATGVQIASNQICYNLLWRGIENEVIPFCREHNISILPWSPMGQGLLTGKVTHCLVTHAGSFTLPHWQGSAAALPRSCALSHWQGSAAALP